MSSKGAICTVLYPRAEGATFNLDYYISTHVPLAAKAWAEYGLKSWLVSKLSEDGPYTIAFIAEFESLAALDKAIASPGAAEVMADLANFSNQQPVFIHGEVVAKS